VGLARRRLHIALIALLGCLLAAAALFELETALAVTSPPTTPAIHAYEPTSTPTTLPANTRTRGIGGYACARTRRDLRGSACWRRRAWALEIVADSTQSGLASFRTTNRLRRRPASTLTRAPGWRRRSRESESAVAAKARPPMAGPKPLAGDPTKAKGGCFASTPRRGTRREARSVGIPAPVITVRLRIGASRAVVGAVPERFGEPDDVFGFGMAPG
jgi:hypothetical protein